MDLLQEVHKKLLKTFVLTTRLKNQKWRFLRDSNP
jgi:hypothetical protein